MRNEPEGETTLLGGWMEGRATGPTESVGWHAMPTIAFLCLSSTIHPSLVPSPRPTLLLTNVFGKLPADHLKYKVRSAQSNSRDEVALLFNRFKDTEEIKRSAVLSDTIKRAVSGEQRASERPY